MEWKILDEKIIHDSPWMKLAMADVLLPNGHRIQHRVIRYPAPTAGTLIHDTEKNAVLLIWRHRFITGRWGWEVPAGLAEKGEEPSEAAARETAEETGYKPMGLTPIVNFNTSSGLMDEIFYGFYASSWEGGPESGTEFNSDDVEADRVEWVPVSDLNLIITEGKIPHGHSLMTILMAFRLRLLV